MWNRLDIVRKPGSKAAERRTSLVWGRFQTIENEDRMGAAGIVDSGPEVIIASRRRRVDGDQIGVSTGQHQRMQGAGKAQRHGITAGRGISTP